MMWKRTEWQEEGKLRENFWSSYVQMQLRERHVITMLDIHLIREHVFFCNDYVMYQPVMISLKKSAVLSIYVWYDVI